MGFGSLVVNPFTKECAIISFDAVFHEIHHTVDPVDPKTVGQFTGLTDKNSKNIYEGDILKVLPHFFVEVYFYKNGMFTCREIAKGSPCSQIYAKESEIIGNIVDNPELMEAKNGYR